MRTSLLSPIVLVVLVVLSLQGAGRAQVAAGPAAQYAAEPLVVEHLTSLYRMESDGTGVREKTVVARIQGESALKQMAVIRTGFAANSEHAEWVYARLRHKDGSVTETPVATAIEVPEPVTREAPFYSDLKELQLPLKDLRVGDQLEWKMRVTRTRAEAEGEFWGSEAFLRDGVVLDQTLELDVPESRPLTVWSPKSKPEERVEGARRIYRWSFHETKPTVGKEADAAREAEKKRVRTAEEELDDREGRLPDVAWTTFQSWAAVGAWYRGLEGDRMVPDAELKARVAQLTAGKATQRAKVQAVYDYVALQIHYIGVGFGIGRYQPHAAADVIANQYGDCKDKHTLLAAMLGALGLEPDLEPAAVLIGAGIRFNQAVPSPAAFNHLMTRLMLDGKPVWLDTTAEVAPFGMLVAGTRNHEALLVPAVGVATVVKTPAGAADGERSTMTATGKLEADGVSTSQIALMFRGDGEVGLRSVLRQVSPAQYDEVAQRMCAGMGYGGTASHMETSRVEDTAVPLRIGFDYKRVKAGDWDNLRVIPQLLPLGLPVPDEKEPPVEAIELGGPRVESSNSAMTLPVGWTAELPEAVHLKSAWATLDQTYRFEKGVLSAERRVEVLAERVPQAEWKAWNKFAQKASSNADVYVQLLRKSGEKAAAPTVVGGSAAADGEIDLAAMVEEAYGEIQLREISKATTLLDQVKAKNPKQARLWGCYGDVALQQGSPDTAVEDYRQELMLHPASLQVYPVLVRVELRMKRTAEAKEDLGRWLAADPRSAPAAILLANVQMAGGSGAGGSAADAAEAVKTLEAALPQVRTDAMVALLGQAQLKAGSREEGRNTLVDLLRESNDTDAANNAAYALADAGLELELADAVLRTVLTTMEDTSRSWTLEENMPLLRGKSLMLQATWDSLGWVLFKEGKLAPAERYVRASWNGRQSPEVGKHLAAILLAQGKKAEALELYELAIATFPGYSTPEIHREPTALQQELTAVVAELRKQGVAEQKEGAGYMFGRMRTVQLGKGQNGYAEYDVLVNAQGLVKSKAAGNKTVPGAAESLQRLKLSGWIPAGSNAVLAVAGILNCHEGACEFVVIQ
jgi:tetratricopeptide (TPR) repeat protein